MEAKTRQVLQWLEHEPLQISTRNNRAHGTVSKQTATALVSRKYAHTVLNEDDGAMYLIRARIKAGEQHV